ncbi:hypothetical protein IQ283_00895 [Alkalihalobacillus hwajinpoensis]|uniref:hypothetical protein n=1 Tax=Guptibacillus hwajinpoensis TaxID=208199 RepID=UPI001883A759|nr:hypothetical protein [Pseudalkalibacillus hwajinpoensis]MBF0705142.1 hypothetical protein [Pseudalkalibacillus hwajinpoensis]
MRRIDALNQLHVVTNQIAKSLGEINPSMNVDGTEMLEGINYMIKRRDETIKLLDEAMEKEGKDWTEDERTLLQQLSVLEEKIQPKLSELYSAFSDQMRRLQQGKAAANNYKPQKTAYSDGAFFDQRK